jgi:hypothetical protein
MYKVHFFSLKRQELSSWVNATPYYLRAKAPRHLHIKNNIDQPFVYGLVSYVIYQVGSSLVMIWHSVS